MDSKTTQMIKSIDPTEEKTKEAMEYINISADELVLYTYKDFVEYGLTPDIVNMRYREWMK